MKIRLPALLLCAALLLPPPTLVAGMPLADRPDAGTLVVIVHPGSGIDSIGTAAVRKLFLGKNRKLPDGSKAVLASFDPARSTFNRRALGRSDAQVRSAWARLIFSGRVQPPRTFDSAEALIAFVAENEQAIAYVDAGALTDAVKPVHVVD